MEFRSKNLTYRLAQRYPVVMQNN